MTPTFTDTELSVLSKIATIAQQTGEQCFLIGGFVRDKLLNRASNDVDIVCSNKAIEIAQSLCEQTTPMPALSIFKTFGTAHLKINNLEVEFVNARKESYLPHSRNPTVATGTLQDDQLRRDFTINTLSISLNPTNFGQLIDPFDGLTHLHQKKIITPLPPNQTFADDPLRMMRAIRFAAQLQFEIDPQTFAAIQSQANRIAIISKERITEEVNKILLSPQPSVGFKLLMQTGLLDKVLPSIAALSGAQYVDNIGHKDNFLHTLQVVDNMSEHTPNLWLRWAALLHDVGKPLTKRFENNHGWTFHGHEAVGAKMVPKIFAQLKLPQNEKLKQVQKLVALHMRPISLTKHNITDSAIRRLLFDASEDIDHLMLLCRADITSKNPQKVKQYLQNFNLVADRLAAVEQADHLRSWQPPVSGELIMKTYNLPPCKKVGILKDAIREAILDGHIENTEAAALLFMNQKAKELDLLPTPSNASV